DPALERREAAELARDERPARIHAARDRTALAQIGVAQLGEPVERHLDVRGRQILGHLLRFTEGAPLAAGQRIALAQRVEDLAAHAPRRVRPERSAEVAAIAPRGLDEAEHAPGDEVLAVRAAAARIERSRGHRPREGEVRDDALVDVRAAHVAIPAPRGRPYERRGRVSTPG